MMLRNLPLAFAKYINSTVHGVFRNEFSYVCL